MASHGEWGYESEKWGFVRGVVDEDRQRSYFVFEIELYRPM